MLLVFSFTTVKAQVTGMVKNQDGAPLKGATLFLKKVKDSTVVKLQSSDSQGRFDFLDVRGGQYFVLASYIGYQNNTSPEFLVTDSTKSICPDLILTKEARQLNAVAITALKPLIEVKSDRTILNVASSINSIGQDALELLRKAPGITVDQNNSMLLNGKSGVQVYINGKPSPLSGDDLADFLKSLQASQIEAIEIISSPSAKFEAGGSAGIINIRLKKIDGYGTNGILNVGYSIGNHSGYNTGISLNHRNNNINIYGSYNFGERKTYGYLNTDRTVADTSFNQKYTQVRDLTTHNLQTGIDDQLSKTTSIGIQTNGIISNYTTDGNSRTPISFIPTGQVAKVLISGTQGVRQRNSGAFNLYYHYSDNLGHTLSIDADYDIFGIKNNEVQPNNYYDGSGTNFLYGNDYRINSPTSIDIYSFKADYEQKLWSGKLAFGIKTSYTNSKNDYKQYNLIASGDSLESNLSDNFNYQENINAGYLNYNKQVKKWNFQAGLRVENTNIKGASKPYGSQADSIFKRNYTGFFPSASFTYIASASNQWTLNFSRRIDRPSYSFLNPFLYQVDEYSFREGNTQLQPQYTISLGLNYLFKQRLNVNLNYSYITNVFAIVADTIDKSKSVLINQNLAQQNITSLSVSYPIEFKWYSARINVNSYFSRYLANFGANQKIDLQTFAIAGFVQQNFNLGNGYRAELTSLYNSPAILQGTFKSKGYGDVDAGLQKAVFGNKGVVKFSVSDIFHTLHTDLYSNFAGQQVIIQSGGETRLFRLFFNYRFGSSKLTPTKNHPSGAEEENRRTN